MILLTAGCREGCTGMFLCDGHDMKNDQPDHRMQ